MSQNIKSPKIFVIFKDNAFKHPDAQIAYTPLLEALETIGIAYEVVFAKMLLHKCTQIKSHDIVLFVDCYLIEYTSEEARNILANIKATKVTINFDDEYMLGWTLKLAQHMHAIITFDTVTYELIRQLGIQVYLCPHPLSDYKTDDYNQKKYEYDVSFIGRVNSDKPERYKLLTKIDQTFPNAYIPALRGEFITTEDMKRVFNRSKININLAGISRFKMDLSLPYQSYRLGFKGRPFEIGLCRGFCLSEPSPTLQKMLVDTGSVGYFSGIDECLFKIQYYLDNPKIREKKAASLYDFSKKYISSKSELNLFSNVILKIIDIQAQQLLKKTMFERFSEENLD